MRFLLFIPLILLFVGISCAEEAPMLERDWLLQTCGQCHAKSELPTLFEEAKAMGQVEFEDKLSGMVHGDLKLSADEQTEASRIMQKLRERAK